MCDATPGMGQYGGTYLVPNRSLRPRLIILGALIALFLIANPWYQAIPFGLVMGLWLGSFPRVYVDDEMIQREFVVMFRWTHVRRWSWKRLVCIETGLEERFGVGAGCMMGILLGFHTVVFTRVLDWMVPWFGGDYKIWVQSPSEKRVLVWQGNSENNFRENLEILQEVSELPVGRR